MLHYLQALGADLLIAVKQGDDLYQASDDIDEIELLDLAEELLEKLADF